MYAVDDHDDGGLVAHSLPLGTKIADRYVVESKIADGTVASVYRARDERAGVEVALKVFDPLRGSDRVARRRFEREFDILTRLHHRGVSRATDFLPGADFDVLVLEFVEGESLRERLARGPLELDDAMRVALDLAETLEVCHREGVIHRDLKPSNIVLHPVRGAVILDFGVAWFSSAMTLTRTGAIVGSPRYLAPETFESADVDERVDVFAVGAILYECLTGRYARDAQTVVEMVADAASLEPPSPQTIVPSIPDVIDRAVMRALSPRPVDRFATAHELRRVLQGAASDTGRALERNLPCAVCGTSLVIDLVVCPGCGAVTEWALERGPFAVQILEVDDVDKAARWLAERYASALGVDRRLLARRLATVPAPLAAGVSSATAEALAAGARAAGCRVEVIRARRIIGPALRLPSFSATQIVKTMAAHFLAVTAVGTAAIFAGLGDDVVQTIPVVLGAVGLALLYRWTRTPLLSIERHDDGTFLHPHVQMLADRLRRLQSGRARGLAAMAVARAAPILLGDDAGLSNAAQNDALLALDDAMEAASALDSHQEVLSTRPRARLRAEAERVDASIDPDRARQVEVMHDELHEIAVAHDLAARRALESIEAISAAIATRTM